MSYNAIELAKDFWTIEDNGTVRMYLMKGGNKAILIDTGYGSGELDKLVTELTGLTVEDILVLHTHNHGDHTSGDKMFKNFMVSEAEAESYLATCPENALIQTIHGGDVVAWGSIILEVLDTPGHTPGAISFLDPSNRRLFSGDNFCIGWPIYMQFPDQDIVKYIESLKYLRSLRSRYRIIFPCHGQLEYRKGLMDYTVQCAEGILNGTIPDIEVELFDGTKQRASECEGVVILH